MMCSPAIAAYIKRMARRNGDGWRVPATRPDMPRMTDHPLQSAAQPITVANTAAMAIARTFIYCTDRSDKGIFGEVVDISSARARAAGWAYHELAAGHIPMESVPSNLARVLHDVVSAQPAIQISS